MTDVEEVLKSGGEENWNYAVNLPERGDLVDKYSLKGSQFQVSIEVSLLIPGRLDA